MAGPGTGKTRTLTHRIAYLCAELGVFPEHCLAITFTRRAAEELRDRLDALLGAGRRGRHRRHVPRAGADASCGRTPAAAGLTAGLPDRRRRRAGRGPRRGRRRRPRRTAKLLREQDLVDLDELLTLPVRAAARRPGRWSSATGSAGGGSSSTSTRTSTPTQYELLRLLSPADGNLCAIGDPDQAIYSFRGADVGYFLRFAEDFTDARLVRLTRNYRSSAPILAAAVQAIAPTSLVRGRRLDPARLDPEAPLVGRYPAATVADEADFVVRTIDELVGGLSHRSLDSGRVDSRGRRPATLSFSDIAVLYRTDAQAGADRRGADPGRHPGAEALARPAAGPARRRGDRPRAAARRTGSGGSLAARVRLAGQVLAERLRRRPTLDADRHARARATSGRRSTCSRRWPSGCGDDLPRVPRRRSRPGPRWTRSTRAPRRSPCSPCTRRRAWSSRWSSWSAARTACCRCAGRARRRPTRRSPRSAGCSSSG